MDAAEIDPKERAVLLDLFTEIAILEHLIRNWLGNREGIPLRPAEFGVLNYFCRLNKPEDRLSALALAFEVADEDMQATVATLVERGFLASDGAADASIQVTAAGREMHEGALLDVAPEVHEVVSLIDPDHLRIAAETLKELRRTIDNLPDR